MNNKYEVIQTPLIADTRNAFIAVDIVSSHIIKRDGVSVLVMVVKKG